MHRNAAHISRLVAIAMLSTALASAASAQQRDPKILRQRPHAATSHDATSHNAQKAKPLARSRPSTSCAEFGAGFVRMPGSDSCIRFGGGVEMGVGAVP